MLKYCFLLQCFEVVCIYNRKVNSKICKNLKLENMKKLKFKTAVAFVNQNGAMEADTISKNGRSSKSLMSRRNLHVLFFLSMALSVGAISCNKINEFDNVDNIRKQFLVDKIYNYEDILVAEYFYDNKNRLIKKTVTSNVGNKKQEWGAYSDEFEYENGRVSKIKRTPNSETHVFYNSKNQLMKSEGYFNYPDFRYESGVVVGFLSKNDGSFFYSDTIVYNNSGNVVQHIHIHPELTDFGQPIAGTTQRSVRYYEYDNNPKPNFGLDDLFIYDPLPFFEDAPLERCLSNNNMTEYIGGSTWTYTYNENRLPSTIEIKWKDIETIDPDTGEPFPMLFKLKYKQIK